MLEKFNKLIIKLNDENFDNKIIQALDCVNSLKITSKIDYYEYQKYVESLIGVEYSDLDLYNILSQYISNDIDTYKKIATDTIFSDHLIEAIKCSKNLSIENQVMFHSYKNILEAFDNITYLDLSFFDRISNPEYNKYIVKKYKQIVDNKIIDIKNPRK